VEEAVGEAADVVRVGGREQEVLAARREQREDLADVADEAHVEHPVRLVEDEDLDRGQVDRPLADVVEQAARRRDDDLGAGPELRDLGADADAAVDRRRADRPVAAVGADALLDLDRELARRHDDEDAHPVAALAAVATGRVEGLDDRQDERGRLAGAGLRACEHVAAVEDRGNRGRLDRGGDRVALVGHGEEQLGRQPETIEGHEERRS
jgi:hypothetical protein